MSEEERTELNSTHPRLRPVEALPLEQNGTRGICLRDPHRYSESMLFVPEGLIPLLQLMDGSRSLGDVQGELTRRFGTNVPTEELQALVDTLDRAHFLDSEHFAAHRAEVDRRFLESPVRDAYLAGQAYPDSPDDLARYIDELLLHPDGPGGPPARPEKGAPGSRDNGTPKGAILPHIDFTRGGAVYAYGYRSLVEAEPADTYVVLGTAHMGVRRVFALTRKDFATPLGAVPADQGFIDRLVEEVPGDYFEDELSHRAEHSIEFQAVLLRCLIGRDRAVSIVPILCGSLHEYVQTGRSPMEDPEIAGFVKGLKRTLAGRKEKVCVIASVDLAHVGPQFGAPEPVDEARIADTRRKDHEMLKRVLDRDPEGFFQYVQEEGDERNVCGLTPIYTMLHALESREVEMIKYGVAPDPQGTVTFASLLVH